MIPHDPATAVHLTLERGDPWLALFLVAFVALCGWMACRGRDCKAINDKWNDEDGR